MDGLLKQVGFDFATPSFGITLMMTAYSISGWIMSTIIGFWNGWKGYVCVLMLNSDKDLTKPMSIIILKAQEQNICTLKFILSYQNNVHYMSQKYVTSPLED